MKDIRITCVAGARPNFIKIAALLHEIKKRPHFRVHLVHTGQHYSPSMSQSFFDELAISEPNCNLGVSGGTQAQQTAQIMMRIEPVLDEARPDILVVVGDVNSTVAAALVAAKMGIRIAHVESGLRSFDRSMPEEINRIVTDSISDYLFVSEPSGEVNLRREGIDPGRIFLVGNIMIDTLLRFRARAVESGVCEELGLERRNYAVLTLHRPSNVDDERQLGQLLAAADVIGRRVPVVFPVHPRTEEKLRAMNETFPNIRTTPPQSYINFLQLMDQARLVLTDSGGIQEETTILQVPCLTLRNNTERPITLTAGTNMLVGTDPGAIIASAQAVLGRDMPTGRLPELWDGKAASRIMDVIEEKATT